MPKITLNGREVEFRPGQTIIEVAYSGGGSAGAREDIPHYCWHPALPVVASCRICQVEVQTPGPNGAPGPKRMVTACNTACSDGMKVETETPAVARARAGNLEGLLLNHPLDCPICDKAGECWLQDYTYEYGAAAGRNDFPRRKLEKRKDIAEHVLLDQERCILCTRCVRFLDSYAKQPELVVVARGEKSVIDIFPDAPVTSNYQGNLADICPVGALTLKEFRFKNRVWYLKGTDSVCPSCSRGCSITLDVRKNELNRVRPRTNPAVNGWFICDVGRFGLLDRYHPAQRATQVKVEGRGATLEDAARHTAARIESASAAGRKVLVLASVDATNEEAWALARALENKSGVELAFRDVPDAGGDGILRTGQPAANVAGLKALGYSPLAPEALKTRAAQAAVTIVFDDGVHSLGAQGAGEVIAVGLDSPLFERAAVVIPGSTFGEKEGTVTNAQGVTQRARAALKPPAGAPGDFAFIQALAEALGTTDLPKSPIEVFLAFADSIGQDQLTLANFPADGMSLPASGQGVHS